MTAAGLIAAAAGAARARRGPAALHAPSVPARALRGRSAARLGGSGVTRGWTRDLWVPPPLRAAALTLAAALDADVLVLVLGVARRSRARRRWAIGSCAARRPSRSSSPPARGGCSPWRSLSAGARARRWRRSPCSRAPRPGWLPPSARASPCSWWSPRPSCSSPPTPPSGPSRSSTTAASSSARAAQARRDRRRSWSASPARSGRRRPRPASPPSPSCAAPPTPRPPPTTPTSAWCARSTRASTARHGTFIAEMGAYRRGDVAELCELVHPTDRRPHRDRPGPPRALRLARRHRAGEGRARRGRARRRHLHHDGRRRALPAHARERTRGAG